MLPAMFRGVVAVALVALAAGAAHAGVKATVRGAEVLNVRRAPSLDSPPIATLPKNSVVTVDKVVDGWAQISLPSGQKGYAKAVYFELPAGIAVATLDTPTAAPTLTPELTPSSLEPATSTTMQPAAAGSSSDPPPHGATDC